MNKYSLMIAFNGVMVVPNFANTGQLVQTWKMIDRYHGDLNCPVYWETEFRSDSN